ncbi:hypothetical protein IL992_20305 [Microbispora sp. NEAU-D428]|uniref:hypothetical protein n=1 Tax=Microbispora sitophila TaxID=2771537 RepID=UPI001868E85F|nr:hypothetical protein [Microbispora sitophila]MBE3011525.1 hypothetical protein [Microbispora sitophila]
MGKIVHVSSTGRVLTAALLMIVACATSAIVSALLTRDADAYTDGHRRVTAQVVRVLRTPVAAARSAPLPAAVVEVVWIGRDGRPHTGRTVTTSGHQAGDRLPLWVDAGEEPAPGPSPTTMVVVVALLAGPTAAAGLWTAGHLVRSRCRAWTARRAVAGWEGEWRTITARER